MTDLLTPELFKMALPKDARVSVNQKMIDEINSLIGDDYQKEAFRDNLLGFASVMSEGKFKLQTFIDAVKFTTFKLLGSNNIVAYTKAFPDRMQKLIDDGVSNKDMVSYASAFNKGKLVQLINKQTMTPTHILNADVFQKAINVQAAIMSDEEISPKVRSDAANSLLTHLKAPEAQKVELDISTAGQSKVVDDLRAITSQYVNSIHAQITSGNMTAQQAAHASIVKKEKVINP